MLYVSSAGTENLNHFHPVEARWPVLVALGLAVMLSLTSVIPAGAGSSEPPPACHLLSSSQASRALGGVVVQTAGDRSSTFCLYARPDTKARKTLVSLTVVLQTNLARAKRLLGALSNIRVDGDPGVWHATPDRYLDGDTGGSASAIKHNLLLLIAVRGVAAPKAIAVQTLSKVLGEI
jgi:hypothetical protein